MDSVHVSAILDTSCSKSKRTLIKSGPLAVKAATLLATVLHTLSTPPTDNHRTTAQPQINPRPPEPPSSDIASSRPLFFSDVSLSLSAPPGSTIYTSVSTHHFSRAENEESCGQGRGKCLMKASKPFS